MIGLIFILMKKIFTPNKWQECNFQQGENVFRNYCISLVQIFQYRRHFYTNDNYKHSLSQFSPINLLQNMYEQGIFGDIFEDLDFLSVEELDN